MQCREELYPLPRSAPDCPNAYCHPAQRGFPVPDCASALSTYYCAYEFIENLRNFPALPGRILKGKAIMREMEIGKYELMLAG
jgi:hypothetical protein